MWLGWMHGMVMMMAYLLKGNDILLCSLFSFNQLDLKEKFFWTFLDTCVWYEGFICQLSWGTNLETPDG